MDKNEYFPRKQLFEQSQDLIATFYSKGQYLSENTSEYNSMLSQEGSQDEFYYCLYLLSMLSISSHLIRISKKILKNMNVFRVKQAVISTEDFIGELDIEEYIKRNYVEKSFPKMYPSIIKNSTYQTPEYQLTLYILKDCIHIYKTIFEVLGTPEKVTIFSIARKNMSELIAISQALQKRYGISLNNKDNYTSLKRKVVYRYKNRKIINNDYKLLMRIYEQMHSLKALDISSGFATELFDHFESFDDRLFEIWLLRVSAERLAQKITGKVAYTPLHQTRGKNKPAACISNETMRFEVFFQNRTSIMPKKDLKWYWYDENPEDEIGAIPDLVFLKYINGKADFEHTVLVDAKNRFWNLKDDMQRVKKEIVQQIYIQSSFSKIFKNHFHSILVAHNPEDYQIKKCRHKDHKEPKENNPFEISAISLGLNNTCLESSLDSYINQLGKYLGL